MKRAAGLALIVATGLAFWFLDLSDVLETIDWMQDAGPLGGLVFVVLSAISGVILVPASWMHGTAGFLYGTVAGPLTAAGLAVLTGSINFFLGRTLLRGWVERKLANSERFSAVDLMIGERGRTVVLLLRVSPISPFHPMSYVLGASRVSYPDFLFGTAIGTILPVLLWSSLGASVSDIGALLAGEATGPGWVQGLGLGITLIASIFATRLAHQMLRAPLVSAEQPS